MMSASTIGGKFSWLALLGLPLLEWNDVDVNCLRMYDYYGRASRHRAGAVYEFGLRAWPQVDYGILCMRLRGLTLSSCQPDRAPSVLQGRLYQFWDVCVS